MNTILQFAIRKCKKTRYADFKLQIRKQYSRTIRFSSGVYQLTCNSSPQVDEATFYLRGSSKENDNNWVDVSQANLSPLLETVILYGRDNLISVSSEVSEKEIIIKIYNDGDYINSNTISRDKVLEQVKGLKISEDNDFKVMKNCDRCGLEFEKKPNPSDWYSHSIVGNICEKCVSKLTKCHICSNLVDKTTKNISSLGEETEVCKRCLQYFNCKKCKFHELTIYAKHLFYIDKAGGTQHYQICGKCSKESTYCKSCNHLYPSDYPKCPCKIPSDFRKMILPYNADVTQLLSIDMDCEIGMEIEVGVACYNRIKYEEIYSHTQDIVKNDAITVFDRSIDEVDTERHIPNTFRGFEIVTRPMGYRNMIRFINNLTEKRHEYLRSWDVKTAGIHIHYNRALLSKTEIGKLLVFINDENNRYMVRHIARRENPRYARLRPKRIVDYSDVSRECHYDAINTNKPHTIEFRIFRGSLKKETILSYIQFVYSAIEFVRNTASEDLTHLEYLRWLGTTNKSSYRELKDRVSTLGIEDQLEVGGEA